MQVDQNLVEQKPKRIRGGNIDFTANDKGIENYIRKNGKKVGGMFDAYGATKSEAPAYMKSSGQLGMFADDTVIGGTGTYNRPGAEGASSLAEEIMNSDQLTPEQRHNQMAVMANTTSPEDFQKMKEEGFNPTDADTNTIVTVTDKIKAALVEMGDYVKGFTDTLSKAELVKITGNEALAQQISNSLKAHDLPVTEQNAAEEAKGIEQVKSMGGLSDTAIAYIMKNELSPSISNLYNAQHMGAAGGWTQGKGIDISGMDDQIRKTLTENGLETTRGNMEDSKWLLSNQIPLTGKNIEYMQQLKTLSGELEMYADDDFMTGEITDAMSRAISEGGRPGDGMLIEGYSIHDRAKQACEVIAQADKEDLAYVISKDESMTVEHLSEAQKVRASSAGVDPEVTHILEMAKRDEELGIGTRNPQIAFEETTESTGAGLSAAEQQELAAKMMGGAPVEAGGMTESEMDQVVARMTAPPEEIPDVITEASTTNQTPSRVKGGNVDLVTDGKEDDPNYTDPTRGNMVNVTTESLERMGYAEGRDDYGTYDYSSRLQAAHTVSRNTDAPEFKGAFPDGYNDYLADYTETNAQNMPRPNPAEAPMMPYPMGPYGVNPYSGMQMDPSMMQNMMSMMPYGGMMVMTPYGMMPAMPMMPMYSPEQYNMMTARATVGQRREMNQRINMITSQRQLQEARFCMSMQANQGLMRRGIAIDTRPLEQLVNDLRTQEYYYYEGLLRGNGIMATQERINIFANTSKMVSEMQYQPAYILNFESSANTIPEIHNAGAKLQKELAKANKSYENMMTRPNEELGDDITKAFQNIDDILNDLDMELTDGNRRAVRILSYNQIEITPENVLKMKAADEEVQRTFKNLTPAVTMEMIRQDKNPLDMTIQEVNDLANEIRKENGDENVERFSKYLYKMEQNHQITEDQRSGYIGIYRLISQVEKSDGAAIGFLVNQGAEVTMRNLLTAVRSQQRGEMDYTIGDKVVGETPDEISARIDTQIESAFQHNVIRDVAEDLTPQKVMTISQEKLMDMSPEQLKDAVYHTEDDVLAEDAYNQEEFQGYTEAMNASQDIYSILDRYDVPNTMVNIIATARMFKSPSQMFKDIWRGGGNHAVAEMKKQVLKRFGDALKNPEELEAAEEELAETAEAALKEMVEEQDGVRHIDVKEMKIMNHQFHICARRAREETYMVPMRMGGLITGVNLKVVRGEREKGMVDLTFDNNKVGKLAASFEAKDNSIVGFIATDRQYASDFLDENIHELMTAVSGEDGERVNIQVVYSENVALDSYEMKTLKWENRLKANGELAQPGYKNPVQTRRLYKIAENFLDAMQKLTRAM